MTNATSLIAHMASTPLPSLADGEEAPNWVHILPAANGSLETMDGRGPYFVRDVQAIIDASMADGEIPVDQDHAMGKAAARGDPAPARGWITEMQARTDGIWAKVRWTKEGRELVASQAYRKLSPVIRHLVNGTIIGVREVSLVNRPNLRGLHALNQEGSDMLHEKLNEMLGLEEGTSEEQVLKALGTAMSKGTEEAKAAPQSELDAIGTVLGLEEGTKLDEIVTAAQAVVDTSKTGETELSAMQSQIDELTEERKKDKAEAFVDAAIREGRQGVRARRDEFIAMHMETPKRAENIVSGLGTLGPSGASDVPPEETERTSEMSAQDLADMATAYQKKCADEGRIIDAAQAVEAVLEEKS